MRGSRAGNGRQKTELNTEAASSLADKVCEKMESQKALRAQLLEGWGADVALMDADGIRDMLGRWGALRSQGGLLGQSDIVLPESSLVCVFCEQSKHS